MTQKKKLSLAVQIFIGLFLGIIAGFFFSGPRKGRMEHFLHQAIWYNFFEFN